jgi:Uma2 family endonuclease
MLTSDRAKFNKNPISGIAHDLIDERLLNATVEEEDEMGETTLHYLLTLYLFTALRIFYADKEEPFVAANLNIFYDEEHPNRWLAPDVMVAFGVGKHERTSYHLASEGVMPQVIFEVASARTVGRDLEEKYEEYERLGVEEYYILDAERRHLPRAIVAYQRVGEELIEVGVEKGIVYSPRMELEIVDTGEEVRLIDPKSKRMLLTPAEAAAKAEAEAAKAKAEAARAEALERELAELKALLGRADKK